jgi:hypothetical protein
LVLAHYEHLDAIPDDVERWDPSVRKAVRGADRLATTLSRERDLVGLFRDLATLRIDRDVLPDVAGLEWRGPTPAFEDVCRRLRSPALAKRAAALVAS